MKFMVEVYEDTCGREHLIDEIEKDFDTEEDAEVWASEHYNTDCYASVYPIEE